MREGTLRWVAGESASPRSSRVAASAEKLNSPSYQHTAQAAHTVFYAEDGESHVLRPAAIHCEGGDVVWLLDGDAKAQERLDLEGLGRKRGGTQRPRASGTRQRRRGAERAACKRKPAAPADQTQPNRQQQGEMQQDRLPSHPLAALDATHQELTDKITAFSAEAAVVCALLAERAGEHDNLASLLSQCPGL